MKSDKTKALFDAITGIDEDLIDEAASPSRLHPARPILRVAAIAAVIALLMTALLWPDKDGNVAPYFSVYVYADAENNTEPLTNQAESAVSNIIPNGSTVGETASTTPRFGVGVEFNSLTENYNDFKVFCNGEEVTQRYNGISVAYVLNIEDGKHTGLYIMGVVEESSRISLVLYDNDGSVMQRYTIDVTPSEEGYVLVLVENYICPPPR